MNISRRYPILLGIVTLVLALSACLPGSGPTLRVLHNQTWSAHFDVQTEAFGSAVRFPLKLDLTFQQSFNDINAEAGLTYESFIQLQTGSLVHLQGRLGLDDSLHLADTGDLLNFDGRFMGDQLVGTVSIAGLIPVGDVVFTRSR